MKIVVQLDTKETESRYLWGWTPDPPLEKYPPMPGHDGKCRGSVWSGADNFRDMYWWVINRSNEQ